MADAIDVILDGDNCWPELKDRTVVYEYEEPSPRIIGFAALPQSTRAGRTAVAVRVDLANGTTYLCMISMRNFLTAARVFAARYGDEG